MGFFSTVLYNIKNMKKAKQLRAMGKEALLALDDQEFFEAVQCLCEDAVYDIERDDLAKEQIYVYTLWQFDMEVNNGGLCQFFVNSSGECAPFVSDALEAIGAVKLQEQYNQFIEDNQIDVHDLSSFKVDTIDAYIEQTERFDFDSFDNAFYEEGEFYQQLIDYARANIEKLLQP